MNKIKYLATPYTHKSKKVMKKREADISRIAGQLMLQGHCIYSPISETVEIARHSDLTHTNWDFWRDQDLPKLAMCDELWIVMMDGWKESVGVRGEVKFALNNNIKIEFLDLAGICVYTNKSPLEMFEVDSVEDLND